MNKLNRDFYMNLYIFSLSSISENKFTILVNFYIYFLLPLLFRVFSIWIFNFFSLFYNFYHFLIFWLFVLINNLYITF